MDVNVLVALADAGHAHHLQVVGWYAGLHAEDVICTCATTELGLLRAMLNVGTQPNLPSAQAALAALKQS